MKTCPAIILAALLGALAVPAVRAQPGLADWPPSPYSLPASTPPQSAALDREVGRALKLHAATTNLAIQQMLAEMRGIQQQLAGLEAEAYRQDPLLLTCDQYVEKARAWVLKKHGAEVKAQTVYFGVTNPAIIRQRQQTANELAHLMDLILLKELGSNTNFAPLIKSIFDVLEEVRLQNPSVISQPERCFYPYWRTDRQIGFHSALPPVPTNSFGEIQRQIDERYPLLTARVAQIQNEQNLPLKVVTGLKYSQLSRMLDGAAEMYLDCHTPEQVRRLREDLRRLLIDLSWREKQSANRA